MEYRIKNKEARRAVAVQQKAIKAAEKRKRREKRKREQEELGDQAPPKKVPRTLENTREFDETIVDEQDYEVAEDEALDKFAGYFTAGITPKILVTTCEHPSKKLFKCVQDFLRIFPNSFYYARGTYEVGKIVKYAKKREFTDLLIITEHRKKPSGLYIVHLPDGPTAHYRLTNYVHSKKIPGHASMSAHQPEVVLNNFNTRLGHTVGRMFAALFPQVPEFQGRRVATFHNQRDFIFFRQHRYIFENKQKVRMQEMGPRFTLKLKYIQHGVMDTKHGEYEWIHKTEMDTSRRRFFL